jgi:hypothetical protein
MEDRILDLRLSDFGKEGLYLLKGFKGSRIQGAK